MSQFIHNYFHLAIVFKICGRQDFDPVLEADDKRLATNSPDTFTIRPKGGVEV
jgi:hypothetical protein